MQIVTRIKNRHIAGLDGLRALAVIAVIAYHIAPGALPGGYIGVDIFFVISGFLISTLLMNEHDQTGTINFKKFWMRRARRLLPALIATICIVGSVVFFIKGDILVGLGRQILGATTFSTNWIEIVAGANYFDTSNLHLFANFWSLAVEEQFYVIWPFIVAGIVGMSFFARRSKSGVWVCFVLAITSAVSMALIFQGTNATRVYYGTDTHLFGLMIGAMLAFWRHARFQPSRYSQRKRSVQLFGALGLIGIGVLMAVMSDQSLFTYRGGLLLASVFVAFALMAIVSSPGLLRRLFTWRPLEWVGVRSYGMYLWHWPLLVLLHRALPVATPLWVIAGVTCVLTVAAAGVSFRYLETPIREYGLRTFLVRGIRRQETIIDTAVTQWRVRPHPVLFGGSMVLVLTVAAVVVAPSKTQAQLNIEVGENVVKHTQQVADNKLTHIASASPESHAQISTKPPIAANTAPATPSIMGDDITLVGDSVALAAAPALVSQFPGILIDAKISRSMREGGFDAVSSLDAAGNLRHIVIIALGTNGYYGTGNLDTLMARLGDRRVVFVTSHADREWTIGNNVNLHQTAKKYPNMYIAEWDVAITSHPEYLVDGIHPDADGGKIYADSVATALAEIK